MNVSDVRWVDIRSRAAHNAMRATAVAMLQVVARAFAFRARTGSAVLSALAHAQFATSPSTCTTRESIGPSCCVILRSTASPAPSMQRVAGMLRSRASAPSPDTGATPTAQAPSTSAARLATARLAEAVSTALRTARRATRGPGASGALSLVDTTMPSLPSAKTAATWQSTRCNKWVCFSQLSSVSLLCVWPCSARHACSASLRARWLSW